MEAQLESSDFWIDLQKLKKSVVRDSSQTWTKSKLVWKEDRRKSKKNIVHSVRYLLYGIQLIEEGKIVDYTAGNNLFYEIMSTDYSTYEEYQAHYKPLFDSTINNFRQTFNSHIEQVKPVKHGSSPHLCTHTRSFIQQRGLKDLTRLLSISVKRHPRFTNLNRLTHDEDTPQDSAYAQECNGVVLDENNNWNVVVFPFPKIFDCSVTWFWKHSKLSNTWKVQTWLEGEQVILFHYQNEWIVMGCDEDKFWNFLKDGKSSLAEADPALCFTFVLSIPETRQIVQKSPNGLFLLSVYHRTTAKELAPESFAEHFGWKCVETMESSHFDNSIQQVIVNSKLVNPMEQAGFLIVDSNFHRMSAISPQFTSIRELLHSTWEEEEIQPNRARMFEIVRCNNFMEFLNYFPQLQELYYEIADKFAELNKTILEHLPKIMEIENVKKAASEASKLNFGGILMLFKNKKINSIEQYWTTQTPEYALWIMKKCYPDFLLSPKSTLAIYRSE